MAVSRSVTAAMPLSLRVFALIVAAAGCAAATAHGAALRLQPSNNLTLALGSSAQESSTNETPDESLATPDDRIPWGEKGCFALQFSGGYADDFEETGIVPLDFGFSWFPIRNFSIDLQLEAAAVFQDDAAGRGDDALGGGIAMMLRWHFFEFGDASAFRGSLYADLGVGFLALTERVPPDASDFVFTPRAGAGVSIALDDYTRVLTGVRWYHISNAQTARENPGLNALQLYAGISFAF